jgi:N-methylhydantoinase A
MARVLLPAHAGVLSAYGLIAARAMQERSRTHLVRESAASPRALAPLFRPLVSEARAALRAEGIRAKDTVVERLIDCRYAGQSFDLTVPFGPRYVDRFHALHHETYGFHAPDRPVEAVTLRVRALGGEPAPPLPTPRPDLAEGTVLTGPEVVPFRSSTTFIPRGWQARVDERGGLLLTPKGVE